MDTIELEFISEKDWVIHPIPLSNVSGLMEHIQHKLSAGSEVIGLELYGESKKTGKKKLFIHHVTRGQAEGLLIHLDQELSAPVSRLGNAPPDLRVFGA